MTILYVQTDKHKYTLLKKVAGSKIPIGTIGYWNQCYLFYPRDGDRYSMYLMRDIIALLEKLNEHGSLEVEVETQSPVVNQIVVHNTPSGLNWLFDFFKKGSK